MRRRWKDRGGFTLVELMLVVVIIAVLAGVVLPRLVDTGDRAKIAAVKAQLRTFETLLYTYQLQIGSFPSSDQGLMALIEDPGLDGWSGPYLTQKSLPKDPWGGRYVYVKEGTRGIDYDVFSMGPDGNEGTEDDVYATEIDDER